MATRLAQVFHLAGKQQSNFRERGGTLAEQRKWDQQTEITKQKGQLPTKPQVWDLLDQRLSSKVRVSSLALQVKKSTLTGFQVPTRGHADGFEHRLALVQSTSVSTCHGVGEWPAVRAVWF